MAKQDSTTTLSVTVAAADGVKAGNRTVAAEAPVALTYNGMSHVVLMATPADLVELAAGFTLSEEIVRNRAEIAAIDVFEADRGFIAKIEIPKERLAALIKRPRNLVGQSGCGLCGVEDIENAVRSYAPITTKPVATKAAVFKALEALPGLQPVNAATGAVHGAAFVRGDGSIARVCEDVGRHNAFDKLIGHRALAGKDFAGGFVLLTSRCSFELVQKALAMKISLLVTISAPTGLAVELARDHNLTLIALARADSMLVVSDPFDLFS